MPSQPANMTRETNLKKVMVNECHTRWRRLDPRGSIRRMKSYAPKRLFVAFAAMLVFTSVAVTGWEAQLQSGTRIRVDPRTNRATAITEQGVAVPLWDGVHRLRDGSSITTHSGVVVPNVEILEESEALSRGERFRPAGVSPCVILKRKVCGPDGECANTPACDLARQVLAFKQGNGPDEARTGSASSSKCLDALQDETVFPPCEKAELPPSPPCQRLLKKACGAKEQCAKSNACSLSHQLVRMEDEQRLSNLDPDAAVLATRQCQDALLNEDLFQPCDE